MATDAEQLAAALAWKLANDTLKAAKEDEAKARAAAIDAVFPDGLVAGTTKAKLSDGRVLKAVRKAEAKVLEQSKVKGCLDRLRKLGDVGALLADRLVKFTAEASLSEFKKLDARQRRLFDGVIAERAGGPSLELLDA